MKTAAESYALLTEGNTRYSGNSSDKAQPQGRLDIGHEFIEQQRPHTIIVGCSDSRVPVERVFDQGAGDLFVVRVAGNILAPALVGSVEFAAAEFGSRLVVVLGHRHCGAIGATIKKIQESADVPSPNINVIVDTISSNVASLFEDEKSKDLSADEFNFEAMRTNVKASAEFLRNESPILKPLIQTDGLRVVGAEFDVKTGVVDFFDGVPLDA